MRNLLANPEAYNAAADARMLKIDPTSGKAVAEYVYTLEPMAGFPGETTRHRTPPGSASSPMSAAAAS